MDSLTPAILFATTKYVYDFKYVFDVTLMSVCSLLFLERTEPVHSVQRVRIEAQPHRSGSEWDPGLESTIATTAAAPSAARGPRARRQSLVVPRERDRYKTTMCKGRNRRPVAADLFFLLARLQALRRRWRRVRERHGRGVK